MYNYLSKSYVEYTEEFRQQNRTNRQINRDLDKIIAEEYRSSNIANMTFTDFKLQWKEAQKLKKLKKHYSAFEPLPNETISEFKERLHGVSILIPTETIEQFNQRIGKAFIR